MLGYLILTFLLIVVLLWVHNIMMGDRGNILNDLNRSTRSLATTLFRREHDPDAMENSIYNEDGSDSLYIPQEYESNTFIRISN